MLMRRKRALVTGFIVLVLVISGAIFYHGNDNQKVDNGKITFNEKSVSPTTLPHKQVFHAKGSKAEETDTGSVRIKIKL